jgi:hypothetical protein
MKLVIGLAATGLAALLVMLLVQALLTVARQQGDDTPDSIEFDRKTKS